MRILFLTGQMPYPPQAGGALRTFGLLDGLHRAGHILDLIPFVDADPSSDVTAQPPAALAQLCDQIITVPTPHRSVSARLRDLLLTGKADMSQRFYSPRFAAALKTQLMHTTYDMVQIEILVMASFLPSIQSSRADYADRRAVRVINTTINVQFVVLSWIH